MSHRFFARLRDARWPVVAALGEIPADAALGVVLDGRRVLLFCVEARVVAFDERCPHEGGRLGERLVDGCVVVCPVHGWSFDARTGRSRNLRAHAARLWRVRLVGDEVRLARSFTAAARSLWRGRGSSVR